MKKGVLFVLTACIGTYVHAQTISGTVQDKQTQEPLMSAVIACGQQKVLSGRDGRFSIKASNTLPLIVSMVGYKKDTITISDTAAQLVISMQRLSKMLDDVVITGTMKAVLKTASPVPVEVYTPQFFRRNPTPTIFDALQQVNGVRPQLNCNVCNTGDIHINGLEGPYTMVLIDGMPIVSSLSSVYWFIGDPEFIGRTH